MCTNKLINCGDCKIQSTGRVSIKKQMTGHKLNPGDIVTVYFEIKKRYEKQEKE